MNRNNSDHFSQAPHVQIERSKWKMPQTIKTSFNIGACVPFFCSEVLPGDTWNVSTSKLMRMQTLKTPIMDDIYLDTYYFYVPTRLVWDHWKNFMGESPVAWRPEVEYTVPQLTAPSGGWNNGTVADYLGIPTLVEDLSVSALPFRCYAKIIEDWFRDVNLQDAQVIDTGDSDQQGLNQGEGNYLTEPALGGTPFTACKLHDAYTSALPQPQRGPDVTVNLTDGYLPVYTVKEPNEVYIKNADETATEYYNRLQKSYPIQYTTGLTYPSSNFPATVVPLMFDGEDSTNPIYQDTSRLATQLGQASGIYDFGYEQALSNSNTKKPFYGFATSESSSAGPWTAYARKTVGDIKTQLGASNTFHPAFPVNLVAGTPDGVGSLITINELRQAFQIQRFYERSARSGNRYISIIRGMFGVNSPDARLQRAEYLGGNRIPISVRQIVQTSATQSGAPLGDVAALSVTGDKNNDFEKSFTEHGYIIGIMVARYNHTYQQGLDPMWTRKTMFDYYWPTFAHLGEKPVFNEQLYATGTDADKEVFGYQEAWYEYRYLPNRVSGMMRTNSSSGLDSWHLADYYASQPYLSASWISEDKTNVDRVLAVSSAVSDQIFADVLVDSYVTRAMPLYSIPGLIDHF